MRSHWYEAFGCWVPLQKHSLRITVHSAQLEEHACAGSLVCCAQVASSEAVSPRAKTDEASVASSSGGGAAFVSWEEEVAFQVGHIGRPQHLKLVLYAPAGGRSSAPPGSGEPGVSGRGREYVAAGSLGLESLLEPGGRGGRQRVSVPVVDEVGRHAGEVSCTVHVTAPQGGAAPHAARGQPEP
ncbi:hypothetical protein ABPG75_013205 [Micractinium tetrahymenae]